MGNNLSEEIEKGLNQTTSEQPKSPNQKLAEELGKQLITLVVIGKTGAGKSTWINAFISFLAGKRYREKRLVSISQRLDNVTQVCNIKEFGAYQNERVSSQTEAQTTGCTLYRVITDKYLISISDTPGLDESKMDDSSHIQRIAEHVVMLSQINAIVYIHKDAEVRTTESLQEMTQKYFQMLSPETIIQKLVVCFSYLADTTEKPKSIDTLRKLKIISDFPATKWFAFKNDNWQCSKVAQEKMELTLAENGMDPTMAQTKIKRKLESNSDDWDYNMVQYQRFLDAVALMEPPVTTEKMFMAAKLKEGAEEFIRMAMENLKTKSEELVKVRKTKAQLKLLLELLDGDARNKLLLSYPVRGMFESLFSLAESKNAAVYSLSKQDLCTETTAQQIDRGWFGSDDTLSCCGAKKSQHSAIYFKLGFRDELNESRDGVDIEDPSLLGFTKTTEPVTCKEDYTHLIIVYLKNLMRTETKKETEIFGLIKTTALDGKAVQRFRDQIPGKDFLSMMREKHIDLYKELKKELESDQPCNPSPGCLAVLSSITLKERLKLFADLEGRFAACRPFEIKKISGTMEEGGNRS